MLLLHKILVINPMNSLVLNYNKFFQHLNNYKSENLGFYFSFAFHFIILISAIGIPNFFTSKQINIPNIIPIEIINISDITSISKENTRNQENQVKKIQIKEKKFNSSDNQEIKKIEIKEKTPVKKNELEKNLELKKSIDIKEKIKKPLDLEKEKIQTNNIEKLPIKKIKLKLKPLENILDIEKKNNSDVKINNKPKIKPEPEFSIASMLKDLRNEKSTKQSDADEQSEKDILSENFEEVTSEDMPELSISEIDLVLQQLSKCFIAPAGAEIKKTMFVKISAKIQQNRRVYENSIRIVDTNISKSSPVYGPITESAMRTLLNPECTPLLLPEDKYDLWKNLTMKFDYSIMRGG